MVEFRFAFYFQALTRWVPVEEPPIVSPECGRQVAMRCGGCFVHHGEVDHPNIHVFLVNHQELSYDLASVNGIF